MNNQQYKRHDNDPTAVIQEDFQPDVIALVKQQASAIRLLESRISALERKLMRAQSEVSLLQDSVRRHN